MGLGVDAGADSFMVESEALLAEEDGLPAAEEEEERFWATGASVRGRHSALTMPLVHWGMEEWRVCLLRNGRLLRVAATDESR